MILPKTRKQIAYEYGVNPVTLRRRLEKIQIQLPSGDLFPAYQKLVYQALGYPPGVDALPSIETSLLRYFIDNDISYARYFLPIGEKYFGGYRSPKGYIGYIADIAGNELVNSNFWKIDGYVIGAPWSARDGYFIGLDYDYEVAFFQQKAEEGKLTTDIYQSGEMESLQDRNGDYQPATIFLLKAK